MAFPTINAQQELNNRKILEDLQIKKQLLQKGVGPVASTIPGIINTNPLSMPLFMQTGNQQQTQQQNDAVLNNSSRTAWNQATNQSSGFFVPQDSVFGNSILPVLPRFDTTNPTK